MDQPNIQNPPNNPGAPSTQASPVPQTPAQTLPEAPSFFQKHLKLLIASLLFLILIVVTSTAAIFLLRSVKPPPPAPQPQQEVIAPPPPPPVAPSKFATDSAVLEIRKTLGLIGDQINSVDLVEPQLNAPNIDLEISVR